MDVLQQENKGSTNPDSAIYRAHDFLKCFTKDSVAHGKSATEDDEMDFVTISSIHEVDEDVVKEKFSMAMPVIAVPMMVI